MSEDSIKIGVLFSQTGPMSVTEDAHIQGVLLACEEINADGGVSGRKLDPILLNPEGSDVRYAELAAELLIKHRVHAIFGCCLSTSRKAVLPVVERFNGVLFYPSVYEGFEYSPNVIYGGAVPNQAILPLLEYIFANHGSRFALIGSDTLYAREVNRIVNEFLQESGGQVEEEVYFPFGTDSNRFAPLLKRLGGADIDVIVSTVVGNDSVTFYNSFSKAELSGKELPIASLTTTESEMAKIQPGARAGHLSVAPYFGSLNNPASIRFVKAFRAQFGKHVTPGVYSEVCYAQVHMFAEAYRQCGEPDTDAILAALSGSVFKAPGGDVFLEIETNHFTLRPYVGRANAEGGFDIVWRSSNVIAPAPYLIAYDRTVNKRMTG